MKKILFTLLFALPVMAMAQSTETVTVVTEVNAALVLTVNQNVNLGTIQAGSVSTLLANSNDDETAVNTGTGAIAGEFEIEGTADSSVKVDFTNATLTNSDGLIPTSFTTRVYNGATNVVSGANVVLTSGSVILDIGGTLASISAANAGAYSTSNSNGSPITFTVTYN